MRIFFQNLSLKVTVPLFSSLLMFGLLVSKSNAVNTDTFEFEQCYISGIERSVICIDFEVPENWDQPLGNKISLHAVIIPASGGFAEPDPFVVFAGGPGAAASEMGRMVRWAFNRINESRDIILLDQRGTGQSNRLSCDLSQIPLGDMSDETTLERLAECRATYDVDVRHFTTFDAIRDVEFLRARLGVEQFNIWGGSYGTRIGLLYMKLHPEAIRTAILDGVAAPTTQLFANAARDAERALQMMFLDCRIDEACNNQYPNLEQDFDQFLKQLDEGPIEVNYFDPFKSEHIKFEMTRDGFVEAIRNGLYSASNTIVIPFILNEVFQGNYAPLMALSLDGAANLAEMMSMGLHLSVLCAEELPRTDIRKLEIAAQKSFTQGSFYRFFENACQGWPIKNVLEDYETEISVDIPTLIFSGKMDPVTSSLSAEGTFEALTNATHFIVNGTGHGASFIACGPSLMRDFIKNASLDGLDGTCFETPIRGAFILGTTGSKP